MKKNVTIVDFICDRCQSTEERNINKHTGVVFTLETTRCEDMQYGNSTTKRIDLCQKCSEEFIIFMKLTTPIKELQHHYDTTIGLWCTDKPDLVNNDLLFELKDNK